MRKRTRERERMRVREREQERDLDRESVRSVSVWVSESVCLCDGKSVNLVMALIVIQNLPPVLSTLTLLRYLRLHLQRFVLLTRGLQRNRRAHWKKCFKSTWPVLTRQNRQVQLHALVAK